MKDIVSIPLYLAIIVLNSLEIYLIAKKPAKKRLKSEKMLLSLGIGDLLLGINGVIGFFREINVIPKSKEMVIFSNSFIIFSVSFSILHILLLTFDRFISVYFPIRRRSLMSDNLINICLVLAWIFSVVTSPFVVWHSIAMKSHIYPIFLSIEVFPTLFFLFFVYVMIYRKLRGSFMLSTNLNRPGNSTDHYNDHSSGLTASSMETTLEKDRVPSFQAITTLPEVQESNEKGDLPRTSGSTSSYSNVELLSVTSVNLKITGEQRSVSSREPMNKDISIISDSQQKNSNTGDDTTEGKAINKISKKQQEQFKARRHSSQAYRQEQRILILGISIIISFAICFLPATLTFLVFLRFSKESRPYFVFSYFFAVLNSISNPILYFFYRYWDKIKRKCRCCCQ